MARKLKVVRGTHTILVAAEEPETLESVRLLLEREGHRVLTANSGERAVTLFEQHDVHLCLIAGRLAQMAAHELTCAIRALDPSVPIICRSTERQEHAGAEGFGMVGIQEHDDTDGPERLLQQVREGLRADGQPRGVGRCERPDAHEGTELTSPVLFVSRRHHLDWLATSLSENGHPVLRATDFLSAVDLFVRDRAHVVVLDSGDLASGGIDFAQRVRTLDPAVPIILLSNSTDAIEHASLVHDLDPFAIYRAEEPPARLRELIDTALGLGRRLARTRFDQDLRSLLLAKFCHDVRNVLHVIHGYSEALQGGFDLGSQDELVSRLGAATETALGLVQHYMDLARLESPGVSVRKERVEVHELFTDLRALATRAIGERPLRLLVHHPIGGAVLYTDGEKLRAILAEVLSNAIKFTASGEIHLEMRSLPEGTRFRVSDPGSGIDGNDLPILFDCFRQRGGDNLSTTPGQGLGLAIALRLSTLLGGQLIAERIPKGGTMVTLTLPCPAEPADAYGRYLH